MATIQDVVKVTIRRETNFVTVQNLDKVLIVSKEYTGAAGTFSQFSSLDDAIQAGYTQTAAPYVYAAVAAVFDQAIVPDYVIVSGSSTLAAATDYVNFISTFEGVNSQWLYVITDMVNVLKASSATTTVIDAAIMTLATYVETTEKFYVVSVNATV